MFPPSGSSGTMRWGSFLAMLRSSRLRGPAVRALPPSNESPAQMARTAATAYSADLASIHDAGFGHVAANAAVELLKHLRKSRKRATPGLVVDVGCGSGILAQAVSAAGYDVLGFDYSEAMLAIARRRAPARSSAGNRSFRLPFPPALLSPPWGKSSTISSIAAIGPAAFRASCEICIRRWNPAACCSSTSPRRAAFPGQLRRGAIPKVRVGRCSSRPRKTTDG